jgi:diguanylate cyclase (GGDEF)-like protein
MAFDESAKQLLEAVPSANSVLSPVFDDDGRLHDVELTWLNASMGALVNNQVSPGHRLQQMYPARDLTAWFSVLLSNRFTQTIDRQYWNLTDQAGGDFFEIDIRWWDDLLLLTATNTAPEKLGLSDALRAANVLTRALPALHIAYAVRPDATWLTFATDSFLDAVGRSGEELRTAKLRDLMSEHDRLRLTAWVDLPEDQRPHPFAFQTTGSADQQRWLELWSMSLESDDRTPLNGIADNFIVLADIDDSRRADTANDVIRTALDKQLGDFTAALDAAQDGYAMWEANQHDDGERTYRLIFMNDAGAKPTGKPAKSMVGQRLEDIVGDGQSPALATLFSKALDNNEVQTATVQVQSPTGWDGFFENTVVPFGEAKVLALYRDVTELQLERSRLIWLSEHDHLTGLPNRRNLEEHLEIALALAQSTRRPAAFIFIDIDDFKLVNDAWGHDMGDLLLQSFVTRLESALGEHGMVARLAGDEFAAVLNDVPGGDDLATILDDLMTEVRKPFVLNDTPLTVTCSAGAVSCLGTEKITDILLTTDKAMYRAKHAGKNCYRIASLYTS